MAQVGSDGTVEFPVYVGAWTNWSRGGRVTGSTLTLSHRNGAFLIAFIALFITFVGSRLWRIACFAIYPFLLSKGPQDGLQHQRHATLRNATDGTSGSVQLMFATWAWRSRAIHPFRRMLPVVAFSITITAALAVASLFSARISSAMGNEVLLAGQNCGLPLFTSDTNPTPAQKNDILDPWVAERISSYANYVQRCYANSSRTDTCLPFVKKRLPTNIDPNTTCPFSRSICRHETGNINIESFVNSQADLGINGPVDFQFDMRIITHCAPLETKNYQKIVSSSQNTSYMQYFLGPLTYEGNNDANDSQYTFVAEQQSPQKLIKPIDSSVADYSISSKLSRIYDGSTSLAYSSFAPVPELVQDDGDSEVIFLSANRIIYTEQVDDDWYAAHQEGANEMSVFYPNETLHAPFYLADEPASKIISTAYTNFSLFWLMFVVVLGLTIILLEFFLETTVLFLDRHGIIKYPSLEWFSNNTLQLQRMAHEELGFGTWDGCVGPHAIPVTAKGELLAVLNRSNPTHPKLVDSFECPKLDKEKSNDSGTVKMDGALADFEKNQASSNKQPDDSGITCLATDSSQGENLDKPGESAVK
ncbi:MAG: hypothetical protein Q9227_001671 [Pyrenula ochraceoflavens]